MSQLIMWVISERPIFQLDSIQLFLNSDLLERILCIFLNRPMEHILFNTQQRNNRYNDVLLEHN
jgi:hypothetical protein